ncbi:MAG: ferric reductase-like transmembrane domain-containing protein [Alphaproteobacteria bacterium]
MALLFRGMAWLGTYSFLVLLPLAVALWVDPVATPRGFWTEAATGAGFVAFTLCTLEFSLVGRFRAAAEPFGIDALMLWHRWMGMAAALLLAAHAGFFAIRSGAPLGWLDPFQRDVGRASGAVAAWLAMAVVGSSLLRRRLRWRYETWQLLHGIGAIGIVLGATLHAVAAGSYSRVPAVRSLVIGYAVLFLLLLGRTRLWRPLRTWRQPWRVAENRELGPGVFLLELEPPRGFARPGFEPGQFAWLVTGRTPFSLAQHPITIASSAEPSPAGRVEFAIKDLGDWSGSVVPALRAGDAVWVDGPHGSFTLDREPGQGFVLVAGGIGISPMRSMLLTLRDREDRRPVVLFHAAPDSDGLVFRDEIAAIAAESTAPPLEVVHVLERVRPGESAESGFLTAEILRRHLPRQYRRFQFYVCGPPSMMDAMERVLPELGVPRSAVHTERFDMV